MPTLAQTRTKVDDWLAARWPTIIARQETYYGNNGQYWQGLWTHTSPPEHTNGNDGDVAPDDLANHPTDQAESWLDFFAELQGVPITASVKMDTYVGPLGPGFVAEVWVKHNNTEYRRRQNYGPESWRTVAWHIVVPPAGPE